MRSRVRSEVQMSNTKSKALYAALYAVESRIVYLEKLKWFTRNDEARVEELRALNYAWELIEHEAYNASKK